MGKDAPSHLAHAHDRHAQDGFAPGWPQTQEGERGDGQGSGQADARADARGRAPGVIRLPPELAALRGLLPDATLAAALARARHLGVGGDEVLIAAGLIDPDA
ncbi:MAG TPA: hypothetical protein PLK13_00240, partial [Xanthobacteraceae bacterium]|nr:hypothetical protein [Xanthobacteraceae bacterium]